LALSLHLLLQFVPIQQQCACLFMSCCTACGHAGLLARLPCRQALALIRSTLETSCLPRRFLLLCRLLHEAEQRSAPDRIEALQALVAVQSMREGDLQGRYRRLCEERDDLRNVMRVAAEVPATAQ
jgi:hypothetical protein